MEVDFTSLALCDCGAVTVEIDGKEYSMSTKTFNERYGIKIQPHTYKSCNYCINHWGVDLCACGSGLPYDKCDEGDEMCGQPMQVIDEGKTHTKATGGWGV